MQLPSGARLGMQRDFSALMRESHRAAALSTAGSTVQAKQQRHVAANRPKDCGKAYAVYLQGLQSSSAARGLAPLARIEQIKRGAQFAVNLPQLERMFSKKEAPNDPDTA